MNDLVTILTLLGIPGEMISSFDVMKDEKTGVTEINLELVDTRDSCPYCFEKEEIIIKDYYFTHINNSVVQHWNIIVNVRMRRYKCKRCGKTYKQSFSLYSKKKRISLRLKQTIIESLKYRKTYSQIARECNVSSTTVIDIFDTLKREARLNFKSVLCIDEFHFGKKKKLLGNFPSVISDPFRENQIIDIIKSRRKDVLIDYFNKISLQERSNVKYFISDMNETYRTIKKIFFKNAIHIIDHFHIMKLFTEAIQSIRIKIMRKDTIESAEYRFLKKNWKLFLMKRSELEKMNRISKRTGIVTSLSDEIDYVLRRYPELNIVYHIKTEFEKRMFRLRYYYDVKNDIDFYIRQFKGMNIDEVRSIGKTMENWYEEIINAYAKNETGLVLTNAVAEANNNNIQTLINLSYGCKNFDRFRNRILYIDRNKK